MVVLESCVHVLPLWSLGRQFVVLRQYLAIIPSMRLEQSIEYCTSECESVCVRGVVVGSPWQRQGLLVVVVLWCLFVHVDSKWDHSWISVRAQ